MGFTSVNFAGMVVYQANINATDARRIAKTVRATLERLGQDPKTFQSRHFKGSGPSHDSFEPHQSSELGDALFFSKTKAAETVFWDVFDREKLSGEWVRGDDINSLAAATALYPMLAALGGIVSEETEQLRDVSDDDLFNRMLDDRLNNTIAEFDGTQILKEEKLSPKMRRPGSPNSEKFYWI